MLNLLKSGESKIRKESQQQNNSPGLSLITGVKTTLISVYFIFHLILLLPPFAYLLTVEVSVRWLCCADMIVLRWLAFHTGLRMCRKICTLLLVHLPNTFVFIVPQTPYIEIHAKHLLYCVCQCLLTEISWRIYLPS